MVCTARSWRIAWGATNSWNVARLQDHLNWERKWRDTLQELDSTDGIYANHFWHVESGEVQDGVCSGVDTAI